MFLFYFTYTVYIVCLCKKGAETISIASLCPFLDIFLEFFSMKLCILLFKTNKDQIKSKRSKRKKSCISNVSIYFSGANQVRDSRTLSLSLTLYLSPN